ncbi:MAG: tetratricopeptide repeat protein, partial [Saprospiraceae bacterium]|nr:tetratricopeptide repeat protein [Saprospiraceae bacterium]
MTALVCMILGINASIIGQPQTTPVDTAILKQVDSMLQTADKHINQKKYEEALELIDKAATLSEVNFGKISNAYSAVMHYKGKVYYNQLEYAKAESYWEEDESIKCSVFGRQSKQCARAKQNIGLLYRILGKLDASINKLNEAKEIYSYLGVKDRGYAHLLQSIGNVQSDLGQYERAIQSYKEADTLVIQLDGKESTTNLLYRLGMATAYYKSGAYELAEAIIIDIKRKQMAWAGKKNDLFVSMIILEANILDDLGQYEKTLELLTLAKGIREELGMQSTDKYANILNNLATTHTDLKLFQQAISNYEAAAKIFENKFGKNHPSYLSTIKNLAAAYIGIDSLKSADSLLTDVLRREKEMVGINHPSYATTLFQLSDLYLKKKQFTVADSLLTKAKIIWNNSLVSNSLSYVTSSRKLAVLKQKQGLAREAANKYRQLQNDYHNLLTQNAKFQPERQLSIYLARRLNDVPDLIFSFLHSCPSYSQELLPFAFNNILFQKGFILYATSHVRQLASRKPVSKNLYQDLIGLRQRLASEYTKPVSERVQIFELESRADSIEKELVRTVTGFGESLRQVTWQEVRDQLNSEEVAIEFVRYRYYDFNANMTDSVFYAALVLSPGDSIPQFVTLCEERQLESAIKRDADEESLRYQNIYSSLDGSSSLLYTLLWKPLEINFQGVKKIYFSPSGLLHQINLAAIQSEKRKTLSDRYDLVILGSMRHLVIPTQLSKATNSAAVFGGIRYEMDSIKTTELESDSSVEPSTHQRFGVFEGPDSTNHNLGVWKYLKDSDLEASHISGVLTEQDFQVTTYRGFEATETAVQNLGNGQTPSPRVLHIATHGFFFPDPNSNSSLKLIKPDSPYKVSDHPMIRSGLLLASA